MAGEGQGSHAELRAQNGPRWSAIAVLKFLTLSDHGAPHFHFALGLANYIARSMARLREKKSMHWPQEYCLLLQKKKKKAEVFMVPLHKH